MVIKVLDQGPQYMIFMQNRSFIVLCSIDQPLDGTGTFLDTCRR